MQKFHLSFCSPLHGRLQLQGWGLATGAGQAGSSLIPHPLPGADSGAWRSRQEQGRQDAG